MHVHVCVCLCAFNFTVSFVVAIRDTVFAPLAVAVVAVVNSTVTAAPI